MTLRWLLRALFRTTGIEAGFKGSVGESKVSVAARFALPKSAYTRFHDVILPVPDGTTQIDHVFVSRFGVFVVETKNMGGWIFGSEQDRQWTQMFRGRRKFRFQNPLRQNYRHVKAVEAALAELRLPKRSIKSVVAFIGDAELKTAMPGNVTVGAGFASYIRSFRDPILSDEQVRTVCRRIEAEIRASSAATNRQHVRALRARELSPTSRKCARCGKPMVMRTTRNGPNAGRRFWGCSGYPKCRYTH